MRKLIIHIGAHKTGTTAIQRFFCDHAEYMEKQFNLIYPKGEFLFLYGQHYIAWLYSRYHASQIKNTELNKLRNKIEYFKDLVQQTNNKSFILSSENFMWVENPQDFLQIVQEYFEDINVILYVRRQVEAAPALYQTDVLFNSNSYDFMKWFEERQLLFDYYSVARRWEEIGCKVIVRPYIREKFPKGDINLDFLSVVSTIMEKEILPPQNYNPLKYAKINITAPDFITLIARDYNSQRSKNIVLPWLIKAGLKLSESLPDLPKYDFIPPSIKRTIWETYKNSNELLCEKYLGSDYLNWLNKEIEESDDDWQKRFGYEGSHLVELIKAFIRLLNSQYESKINVFIEKPKIEYYPAEEVEFMRLDVLQMDLLGGGKLSIGGLVLLKKEVEGDYQLILKNGEEEREIQWNISSPFFAKSYPDNPKAKNARFLINGVLPSKEKPLEIYL
ncbi:MAG: hypothetical protein NC904_07960, partial [Candidatus Omnitrophica bacterium]|nr:hypothetical protein [Candidatus Omnitrophota bacterium]